MTSRPSRKACTTTGTPLAPGRLDERAEMRDVAVDAAVGDEPEEVETTTRGLRLLG